MLSSLNPNAQQFLLNMDRIQNRMSRAQTQISSGSRINQVSDDPDQIATLLIARQHLEAAKQIHTNLGRTKAEVDTAEQSLQSAVQLFERARTLGAAGASGTQTDYTRAVIGQEVGAVMEQIAGLAGTTVEGRYIFSGDSDQALPYTLDLTQANPLSAYQGSAATRLAQHPNGTTFALAHTAQEIFDSTDPATNVLGTLNTLRQALLSNDATAIQNTMGTISAAGTYLNSQLAFYGTTQNRVAEALDFGQNLQVSLESQIATLSDADLTAAILEMNQSQTQQQAALQSWARLPRTSLFDYLG